MGGKTKQSQRTKNNARPSSSGRSAELLQNVVNLDHSAMAGGPQMTSLFPSLATPNLELGLPSEFLVCIKKLNKKDPITKVKALQELTELVNKSQVDDVVLILPSWAHFYKILSVDIDSKVQEATQVCHAAVSRVAGRRLAPVLRRVVPAWLQARHSDHAPAQACASGSLQATFPENKLPEVILFCKAEIIAHLMDNLLGNAEKTLTKRAEEPEERGLQLQAVVASSLRLLQALAGALPPEPCHRRWLLDQLTPLLDDNTFWKYAAHSNHQLKAAWFAAMTSLLEQYSSKLTDKFGARLAKSLLGAVSSAPPLVAPHVWACLLQLMSSVPDWLKWVDKKDLLSKRILDMLEKGGWGDARRLTDLVLPLLAHLPQDILTKQFYEAFFVAFFNGLRTKSVLNSKFERQYWITSLAECLRYLSIQQNDFVIEVTTSVHRMWLRTALFTEYNQVRTNLIKHSATNMASLVKFWLKQSKESNGEKFDQLIRNFWQNVCTSLLLQIDKPPAEEIEHIIEGHILFLQTLKTGFLCEPRKVQSIKFDDDIPNVQEEKTVITQVVDADSIERYKHNLNEVVEQICCAYFEYADKNDISEPILMPLITIFNDFDSKNLYIALAKTFGANGVYDFYEKVLLKWLMTDTMRCKSAVDIAFSMLKHLTEDEQEAVMASFEKTGAALEWALGGAVRAAGGALGGAVRAGGGAGAGAAVRWLRAPAASGALLSLARRAADDTQPEAARTVLLCLRAHHGTEMVISESTASEIATIASQRLQQALEAEGAAGGEGEGGGGGGGGSGSGLEAAASLAAQLATLLATRCLLGGHDLTLQLFQLLLLVPRGDRRLGPALWAEARGALHDALAAQPRAARAARRQRLLPPALRRLHEHGADSVNITEIEHLASLCPYLLVECDDPEPPADVTEIVEFTRRAFDLKEENTSVPIEVFALRYDCIADRLNCPFDDDNEIIKAVVEDASNDDPVELMTENLVPYITNFLFRALFLHTCFLHKVNSDYDEEEGQHNKTWCEALLNNEYLQMEFCKVLREYMVMMTLDEAYSFWLHHDIIKITNNKLNMIIDEIIAETPDNLRKTILNVLSERAAKEGYYWAYARKFYETKVNSGHEEDLAATMDIGKLEEIATGNGFFHCLQANTEKCEDEEVSLRCQFALMSRSILAAFPAAADRACSANLLAACASADLDPVVEFYHKHDPIMLYERDIASIPWCEVVAEAAVLRAAAGALRRAAGAARAGGAAGAAPQHHWDFAAVTLCAVVANIRAAGALGSTKVSVLLRAASELFVFVATFVRDVRDVHDVRDEHDEHAGHVGALVAEWTHVFGPALCPDMYAVGRRLLEAGRCGRWPLASPRAASVSSVTRALRSAQWWAPAGLPLPGLVLAAAGALARPGPAPYHCLAYHLLLTLEKPLADYDASQLLLWSRLECADEADGADGADGAEGAEHPKPQLSVRWTLAALDAALRRAWACLTDEEDTYEVTPKCTEYSVIVGTFLLADAVFALQASVTGDLAHHYMLAFRQGCFTERLVPLSLRLLPAVADPPAGPRALHLFLAAPAHEPTAGAWRASAGALACRVLYACALGAGADVRAWWAAAARRGARLQALLRPLAPAMLRQEVDRLRAGAPHGAQVQVHKSLPEVKVKSVAGPELTVRYQPSHPLAAPAVSVRPAPAPAAAGWLRVYLGHQNGSLLGAVRLWWAAMDAAEGAPCCVCYCRLQPSSGLPPDRACTQCHNRYHRHCLRKWFQTSQRTSCPLCRTPF